jgi:hypothetical protein
MSRPKIPFGRLALEFIVIIVGVLVALGVNEWAEGRDNDRLARESLRAVAIELDQNLTRVRDQIAYHQEILPALDSLRRLAETGTPISNAPSSLLPQGLGFPFLQETAWETALFTQAVRYFEFGIASSLSLVYSGQETLADYERVTQEAVTRPETFAARDHRGTIMFLSVVLGEVVELERTLATFQQSALEAIRRALGEVDLTPAVQVSSAAISRGSSSRSRRSADPATDMATHPSHAGGSPPAGLPTS